MCHNVDVNDCSYNKYIIMKVVITSAQSVLANAIAEEMADEHELCLLESEVIDASRSTKCVVADHLVVDTLHAAVDGADVLVHTGELPLTPPPSDAGILDWYTRGTYDLMAAAVAAGIRRFVYCGTLELFDVYPTDVYISEMHEPFPPSQGEVMWRYLAEFIVREFVRDHAITGTVLRLGNLVIQDEADVDEPDVSWLDPRDAARVVNMAVGRDASQELNWVRRWQVRHVCANPPNPRFLIDKTIQDRIQFQFSESWKGGHR